MCLSQETALNWACSPGTMEALRAIDSSAARRVCAAAAAVTLRERIELQSPFEATPLHLASPVDIAHRDGCPGRRRHRLGPATLSPSAVVVEGDGPGCPPPGCLHPLSGRLRGGTPLCAAADDALV